MKRIMCTHTDLIIQFSFRRACQKSIFLSSCEQFQSNLLLLEPAASDSTT